MSSSTPAQPHTPAVRHATAHGLPCRYPCAIALHRVDYETRREHMRKSIEITLFVALLILLSVLPGYA